MLNKPLLLLTKLSPSPARSECVKRQRLFARLDAGIARRLTLISTPAGFGKTTLLGSWYAAHIARPAQDRGPVLAWGYDPSQVGPVCDALDRLVESGKIRYYSWSTDSPGRARVFAKRAHCPAVQTSLNMFVDNAEMLAPCDEYNLAAIVRGPLGKGLLTGKFQETTRFPANDLRYQRGWNLQEGPRANQRQALEQLRDILTSDGRTLAQAALGALWARSERIIPIPGFKIVEQVKENAGAMQYGPLSAAQMQAIADVVASSLSASERQPF